MLIVELNSSCRTIIKTKFSSKIKNFGDIIVQYIPFILCSCIRPYVRAFPTLYCVTSASTVPARTHMPVVRVASFFSTMYWMTGVPPSVSGGSHDTVM